MASKISLPDSRTLSYVLDETPKDGPIVLLSNSLCAPFGAWDHFVKILNSNGFRTLRYDQVGHGQSSYPAELNTTFDSMAADVHSLLQALNISSLHGWVGVSMGAAKGVCFVSKYPKIVRKLVICDTISASPVNLGGADVFGPRVAAAREAGSLEDAIQSTLDRWFGKTWLEENPKEAARVRDIMRGTTLDGFEACCHALRSSSFDLRPILKNVGSSVEDALCVVGERDANLPQTMDEMRKEIESGFRASGNDNIIRLEVIKNAGHVCFIDGLEQFSETVVPWLIKN
ncbi:unnamed protein product [Clonostachys solani]|uniref:AB hydrolase-1 domain-containing protein n=1 Tax=Clonostachys solani TaxID=160281 RepID=A0A9P0EJT3_9HYPO|nr:unnamed protein product [Clonostachys solani]